MCIIIVKNKGINIPSDDIIQNCFLSNPDGSGIAYRRNNSNKVIIEKGFMNYDSLSLRLTELNFNSDDLVIYHFRIGTHGIINKENTHPFPLSHKLPELKKLYLETNIAIAHNGIFSSMPNSINNSDTQKFIAFILSNLNVLENLENPAFIELLRGYCGYSSKLAFLTEKKTYVIGNFIHDKKSGLLFSNSGYLREKTLFFNDLNIVDEKEKYHECELCNAQNKKTKYHKLFDGYLCKPCRKEFHHYYYNDVNGQKIGY